MKSFPRSVERHRISQSQSPSRQRTGLKTEKGLDSSPECFHITTKQFSELNWDVFK